ncbi:UNVERIFIED_CONTAM: hypothetical protein RMT77_010860 [Armadillidium vulgare]
MWAVSLLLVCLIARAPAQRLKPQKQQQAEAQQQYPQYPEITACPEQHGLQLYHHPLSCNQFYKCANGTLTHETCENGLLFDGKGAVHNYCNYYWAVNCEGREHELIAIRSGECEYSFGIFSVGPCESYYNKCEYGEAVANPCTPGLAYDDRIHGCNWPDLLETCNPEEFVGFKCPAQIDPSSLAYKFLPFPRFPSGDCSRYVTCVNGYPRLIGCGDYTVFNEDTLTCEDPEFVPKCAKYFN